MNTTLRDIEVKINKAEITNIHFTYGSDLPSVSVIVDLKTVGGETLTSLNFSTNHYKKELTLEKVKTEVYQLAGKLLALMGPQVSEKINDFQRQIEGEVS